MAAQRAADRPDESVIRDARNRSRWLASQARNSRSAGSSFFRNFAGSHARLTIVDSPCNTNTLTGLAA